MKPMNMPGFTADLSLAETRGRYRIGTVSSSRPDGVVPAIPMCRNCDYILDRCEQNGWRPRAVCNACLYGNCYDESPTPDPFPDPFGRPPRF